MYSAAKIAPLAICPSCRGSQTIAIGDLPDTQTFAGNDLGAPMKGGQLFDCQSCSLCFRFPVIDSSDLMNQYKNTTGVYWSGREARRPDHDICEKLLLMYKPTGRV